MRSKTSNDRTDHNISVLTQHNILFVIWLFFFYSCLFPCRQTNCEKGKYVRCSIGVRRLNEKKNHRLFYVTHILQLSNCFRTSNVSTNLNCIILCEKIVQISFKCDIVPRSKVFKSYGLRGFLTMTHTKKINIYGTKSINSYRPNKMRFNRIAPIKIGQSVKKQPEFSCPFVCTAHTHFVLDVVCASFESNKLKLCLHELPKYNETKKKTELKWTVLWYTYFICVIESERKQTELDKLRI